MNSRFIDRMIRHWTNTLRLPCTSALIEGWLQLEEALEAAAKQRRWQVLPSPTGAGKTEALIVLLATPTITEHPGALVVTKFKCEADKIAHAINTSAGATIAIAAHTDAKVKSSDMAASPVVVITHKAYANALREAEDAEIPIRLDLYHQYHQSLRKWLIVDEAFNWVDAYEAERDDLAAMCGPLSGQLPADAIDALKPLLALVRSIDNEQTTNRSDRLLSVEQIAMLQDTDLEILDRAIRRLPTDATEVWRNVELVRRSKDSQRTTFKKQYLELVEQLRTIQRIGWGWLSKRGGRTRLHSSRSLLDTKRMCGVILDATAGVDTGYDLLGSDVLILPRPSGIRSYTNVKIHVSRGHRVGKEYLAKHAPTDWPAVATHLAQRIKPNSKVLAITHKDARNYIRKCGLKCGAFEVAHWGDLDGKNDWKDFDTVVVYGLPYLDDIAPTNAFFAGVGQQSADWFEGQRRYGHQTDMKAAIKIGFIARSVVQAIGRGHCRKITDDQGNCGPTDVFILLPSGDVADALTASIQQEMPGSQLKEWHAAPKIGKQLGPTERKLVSLMRKCGSGTYTKTQIIVQLSIAGRTFERMSANLRIAHSVLTRDLAAIGVEYDCKTGPGKEACFIKY
ncbi:hypothetical protein [Bradyrhizobium sp. LA2.1]|uniref:hypothetical protein n=1 Tax=Bradyrhizobium sp. LA2.1 TaxID=3156376 RepID=UPI0033954503